MNIFSQPNSDVADALGIGETESPVRPEYEMVVPHILALCQDFGLSVEAIHHLNLTVFMRALECLDRYYDAIADEHEAGKFLQHVFLFLQVGGGVRSVHSPSLPLEVASCLEPLREVLHQHHLVRIFIDRVSKIAELSRIARDIRDIREYVRCGLEQGAETGDLVLDVLNFDSPCDDFRLFMMYVAATGKLFDDYRDADEDYKGGLLQIKPGVAFKTRLRLLIMERAAWIIAHHPNRTRAVADLGKVFL